MGVMWVGGSGGGAVWLPKNKSKPAESQERQLFACLLKVTFTAQARTRIHTHAHLLAVARTAE